MKRILAAATTVFAAAALLTVPHAQAAPLACGTTNVAQGRTATASSEENAGTPASAAVDGNPATRWSSAFSDPQ